MAVTVQDELATELATYDEHREELIGTSVGRFVLIKGDQIVATYESERDAIAQGYRQFGNVPFLVKQVSPTERPLNFVSGIVNV